MRRHCRFKNIVEIKDSKSIEEMPATNNIKEMREINVNQDN